MKNKQTDVTKKEVLELAEILVILQRLPKDERIAMQYYMKGALHALQMNDEIEKSKLGA